MNKKGQALVEFVILMPIFIFIAIAIFDVGNIIINKYELENDINVIADFYEENKENEIMAYVKKIDAKIKYDTNDSYNEITLSKKVNVLTPIVRQALGKSFEIKAHKTVVLISDTVKEESDNNETG